jgi:membrane-bound lytic murein transglycosylase D
MVNRNINLAQVSEIMDIPLRLLRDLNPQYLRDVIPGASAPHPLRLPLEHVTDFIDLKDTITTHRANVLLASNFRPINPAGGGTVASTANTAGRERITHTIRSGESLSTIASRYRVTVANLQAWNNLSSTRIVAGRQLVVWVLPSNPTTPATASAAPASAGGNATYHTVRSGDTVWGISQMYSGVSASDILRLNNLTNNSVIRPGMRLRIR